MTCHDVTMTSKEAILNFEAAILNPKPAVIQLTMTPSIFRLLPPNDRCLLKVALKCLLVGYRCNDYIIDAFKVIVNLRGCLPANLLYSRCFSINPSKLCITVRLIKCRIRNSTFLRPFFVYVRPCKPSNTKVTKFSTVNYVPSRYRGHPNKLHYFNQDMIG